MVCESCGERCIGNKCSKCLGMESWEGFELGGDALDNERAEAQDDERDD